MELPALSRAEPSVHEPDEVSSLRSQTSVTITLTPWQLVAVIGGTLVVGIIIGAVVMNIIVGRELATMGGNAG